MYTPKFVFGELRIGLESPKVKKQSLWAEMPDGENYNIWDVLPQELSEDVLSAIRHAFHLGVEAHKMIVADVNLCASRWTTKWEKTEVVEVPKEYKDGFENDTNQSLCSVASQYIKGDK